MPCLRQVSPTFAPASTSLRIRTICSSLNFDFFMQSSLGGNSTSNWLESARTLQVNRLLRSITAPPLWNTSQDNVILGAYPIEVGLDENTHQLISINIFTSWKDEGGPYPVFRDGAICLDGRAGIACPR